MYEPQPNVAVSTDCAALLQSGNNTQLIRSHDNAVLAVKMKRLEKKHEIQWAQNVGCQINSKYSVNDTYIRRGLDSKPWSANVYGGSFRGSKTKPSDPGEPWPVRKSPVSSK